MDDREAVVELKGPVPVDRATAIRQRNRKVVKSDLTGNEYLIRRMHQRDFMPRGLIAMIVSEDMKSVEEIEKYVAEHQTEMDVTERFILETGIVDPKITFDLDKPGLYVLDMGPDKDWVVAQIAEFSGFSQEILELVDKFRREELARASTDEQVLRSAAARVLGHANPGHEVGVSLLEELREGEGETGSRTGG